MLKRSDFLRPYLIHSTKIDILRITIESPSDCGSITNLLVLAQTYGQGKHFSERTLFTKGPFTKDHILTNIQVLENFVRGRSFENIL